MFNKRMSPLLMALVAGACIMAITLMVQHRPEPPAGEYHWSTLLRNNFGWLAITLQMIVAFVLGYYFRANAILTGICLIASLPVVAIWEATVYRGSHNLIPFEFAMYLAYALPAMAATFAGSKVSQARKG